MRCYLTSCYCIDINRMFFFFSSMLAFYTFLILISLCKNLWLLKLRIVRRRACAKCSKVEQCGFLTLILAAWLKVWRPKLMHTKKLKKFLALIRHSYHFHSIGQQASWPLLQPEPASRPAYGARSTFLMTIFYYSTTAPHMPPCLHILFLKPCFSEKRCFFMLYFTNTDKNSKRNNV